MSTSFFTWSFGELHDLLEDDLKSWYPKLAGKVKITLVKALPSVLPMFSKQLIDLQGEQDRHPYEDNNERSEGA
jgi:hypothetical protein